MKYDEVRIQLLPSGTPGKIDVRISSAGEGVMESTFELPLGEDGESIFGEWFAAWRRSDRVAIWKQLEEKRKEIGARLFGALFEQAGPMIREARAGLAKEQEQGEMRGLRLRLMLGDTQSAEEVSALLPASSRPWELLYDPERRSKGFLLDNWYTSLVRTLGKPGRPKSIKVHGPLKVLVASAEPEGFDALDWRTEAARIRTELAKRTDTRVEVLEHASLDLLCERLRSEGFHALHFIGHGGFEPSSGEGRIVLEQEGQPRRVSGQELARRIGDIGTLRLVVLNACHSGELATHSDADPLGSVASALSTAGIPAVVAMQVAVTDSAAVEFSAAFYSALRIPWPIEAAVAEGRKRIPLSSPEWATFVLYLHGESSDLFDFGLEPTLRGGAAELPLGIRSMVESERMPKLAEWAKTLDAATERLLALEEYFEGRFIRDPKEWRDPVLFRLRAFLNEAAATGRPLTLSMAAHATIAFAAGYYLDTKTANPISVIQATPRGLEPWSDHQGEKPAGPLWEEFHAEVIDPQADDVAVVVEISRPAFTEVAAYLREASIPVKTLIRARVAGGPDGGRVSNGAHAAALARELVDWLQVQTGNAARRRLHLFFSAPNAFVFFCGQRATVLGKMRLYEYDMEKTKHGTYEPSLDLPPTAPA